MSVGERVVVVVVVVALLEMKSEGEIVFLINFGFVAGSYVIPDAGAGILFVGSTISYLPESKNPIAYVGVSVYPIGNINCTFVIS